MQLTQLLRAARVNLQEPPWSPKGPQAPPSQVTQHRAPARIPPPQLKNKKKGLGPQGRTRTHLGAHGRIWAPKPLGSACGPLGLVSYADMIHAGPMHVHAFSNSVTHGVRIHHRYQKTAPLEYSTKTPKTCTCSKTPHKKDNNDQPLHVT